MGSRTRLKANTPDGDPRWQVVERIIASPSFQKSERLKAFLAYVVQEYLAGHPEKQQDIRSELPFSGRTIPTIDRKTTLFAPMRGNSGYVFGKRKSQFKIHWRVAEKRLGLGGV
jgi:hypothetical protein